MSLSSFHSSKVTQLADNVQFQNQADYVDIIKNLTGYKRLRVKRIDQSSQVAGRYAIDVVLDDGVKHLTHQWQRDDNDDFLKLNQSFVGDIGSVLFKKVIPNLNGSFVTSSVASYTTTLNDTFTGTVKGDEIVFNHYADDRGGIWEFVIDGDTANPVTISTYSASPVGVASPIIATGLEFGEHTVTATFKGDDPQNPPNGGVSRGWIRYKASPTYDNEYTMLGYIEANPFVVGKDLIAYGSNKEFAISATKDGYNHWFPEHNGVGTCFLAAPIKYILDGVEIDFSNYDNLELIEGKTFKIVEHMYLRLPEVAGDIAELRIVYTIGIDGVVSLAGSVEVLQDFTATGYFMMFPLGRGVNEILSGIDNYRVNAGDETSYNFSKESDRVHSYCAIDSTNTDYVSAVTVDYPFKTLRYGKNGRRTNLDNFTYFLQRATAPKLYQVSLENASLTAGDKLHFYGRFTAGEISSAYHYFK